MPCCIQEYNRMNNQEYESSLEQPQQQLVLQPFGAKLEATARGYRIHVSVHADSVEHARIAALQLLVGLETDLRNHCIPIAPIESKPNQSNGVKAS